MLDQLQIHLQQQIQFPSRLQLECILPLYWHMAKLSPCQTCNFYNQNHFITSSHGFETKIGSAYIAVKSEVLNNLLTPAFQL